MLYQSARRSKPVISRLSASTISRAALVVLMAAGPIVLSTRLTRSLPASEPVSALPMTLQSTKAELADHYGKLPLSFENNEGQTDREVKFLSRGPGYDLFLTATGAVLTLRKSRPPADKLNPPALTEQESINHPPKASLLRLKMIGANPQSRAEGEDQLPGKINYLFGDDPHKWHINIPTYRKVHYTEIYPKVDLVYYGNRTELEYDFVIAPGGNVQAIRFELEGTDRMTLDDAGDLHLAVEQAEVTLRKPVIYQLTEKGDRSEVKGEYVIKGKEVRFKAGAFDAHKPLIIDPVLSYSTLLGGGSNEYAFGIAVDSSGSAYITGSNDSGGFPTTPGAFRTASSNYGNAFVTKLDPTGSSLVYSTYLNGNGFTTGTAIAVDSSGNAYVTGKTDATDFPTVNPIRSSTSNFYKSIDSGGHWNGQVIVSPAAIVSILAVDPLSPETMYAGIAGGGLYKTINGGNSWTPLNTGVEEPYCRALVIDPITPTTIYAALPPLNFVLNSGVHKSTDGGSTWTKLSIGLNSNVVSALAIDPTSPTTIYAGVTSLGVYKSTNGGASWTNSSTGFTYGGTSTIAIDPVTPQTVYANASGGGVFKTTNGGANWGQVNNGLTNTTVQTLNIDPASTIYAGTSGGGVFKSTNGGGNWIPFNNGISGNSVPVSSVALSSSASSILYLGTADGRIYKTIDSGNNWTKVYETLTKTIFTTLAISPASTSTVYAGADIISGGMLNDYEGFVSKLNADGSGLVYSTYLGGNGDDFPNGIAVDPSGSAIVAGQTASSSFPTLNANQSTLSGTNDAFVTKFNATGNGLLYSTLLGGASTDTANAVAVDAAGSAYITGITTSSNFPTLNAFQSTSGNNGDAFATKLNSNGALIYSTYLGGEDNDIGYAIAADTSGSAYITGQTASISFPLVNPIQSTNVGGEAFVTKLNSAGSGLIYSTFLGGAGNDVGRGVAVDSAGNAYVTGFTQSADFPVLDGAIRTKSPFFRSADGGANWNNDNYGLKGDVVTALALDPMNPLTIYAGTRSNVFKSTDGGQTWNESSNGLVRPNVTALTVDPTTPSTVYLCIGYADFNTNGVYKSTNGGDTWSAMNTGLTNTSVLSLAIDPLTPSNLYVGVYGSGIFKSVDGGAHWGIRASQTLSFIVAIAIDPVNPKTIYAGGEFSNGAVFKSTDGGDTWESTLSFSVSSLAIDPVTPSTIYASTGQGIFKSIDGAISWTSLITSLTGAVIIDPVTPTTLYVTSSFYGGIVKSIDGGNSFAPANSGLTYPYVYSVVINPRAPGKIYAGVNVYPPDNDAFVTKINPAGTALVYSTLLGGSPASSDSFFLNDEGFAIAVDSAGNAYVAGESRSPDFPVTSTAFQPFNRGSTDVFVSKLTMSYIISGRVLDENNSPVGDADVTLSNGASLSSVVTESDGAYRFSHLREGGNFTVSATKSHFKMTPTSQSFNNLHSNQTVDFIAVATSEPFYIVSGYVTDNGAALSGVTVTLSGSEQGLTTTDNNGRYSFTLAGGGDYTMTPSLLGFTFTPASRTFNNLSADQSADFAAMRQDFVVTNSTDHGAGSLRQAILDSNATVGADRIVFNIPGPGVQTINLLIALPEITGAVVIDATTQPGYAGTPLIELSGLSAGGNANCLVIKASNCTIRGLVIGRFTGYGIWVYFTDNNIIQGNYIGVDPTGTLRRSNNGGILLSGSSNNLIGGTIAAARNVISSNSRAGVEIGGTNNHVEGNFIGTDASGMVALNNSYGVVIDSSAFINNVIGGTTPGAGNLISGNPTGIRTHAPGTLIQGNLIGTDATGRAALGNTIGISSIGISSSAPDVTIGGTVPGARNIISGNYQGVSIEGAQSRLQGNFIGTDITGTAALGNTNGGVSAADHVTIGGTTPEERNIISANGGFGNVALGYNVGGGDAVTVQGNYIGTDVTGRIALGNSPFGVIAYVSNNLIGGTTSGTGNVISGNRMGVQIGGGTSATLTGNLVQGNLIGLTATGDAPLPNTFDGVNLSNASDNTIGGDGNAGNTIAFNGRNGILISSGTGNLISRNFIFSNVNLGIDLAPFGVTANDSGDADTGANNRQNFPVLTSATNGGGNLSIQGTFNSNPNTSFKLEFFSNPTCDGSGYGEGKTFIGSTNVMTDASGNVAGGFSVSFNVALSAGAAITGTATDSANNTSEFSQCVLVTGPCSYSLSPMSQSFAGGGGAGGFNVMVAAGCSWMATANVAWVNVTSGASGSGNGMVQYSVAANPGSTIRRGAITVGDQTFTVYQGIDFLDVPSTDQFYTEIGKLSARGVTLGCSPGHYCPDDPVLREQMAAFIMRVLGEFNPPTPASQRFGDVPPSNDFYNFIDRLAVFGITLGCQPGNPPLYCPSDPVKREQMSAFILRALGEFNPPTPASQRFGDVPPSNDFYNFIDRLAVLQITLGCQPGNPPLFCPNDNVTRGEMAAFLVRAFNL